MDSCIIAWSHVTKPFDLLIYTPDGKTKNIMYPNALE